MSLHSAQELKLYSSEASSLPLLASLLSQLATSLGGLAGHLDHYHNDHPSLLPLTPQPPETPHSGGDDGGGEEERMECGEGEVDTPTPPHLMNHLCSILRGGEV